MERADCAVSASPEQVRVALGVEQLPEAAWQRLVIGHPALRLELLQAITSASSRSLRLQFFLVEDSMGIAAAAVCELIEARGADNALDALLFGRMAGMVRRFGVTTRSALLFKPPLGRGPTVVVRAADPIQQGRVLSKLVDGIEQHARQNGHGVAFAGVSVEEQLLQSALRERRYFDCEIDSTAQMDIEWNNFDGYVSYLRRRSKQAAQNARTERSRNHRNGVTIRQLQPDSADLQALYDFTREHHRHKNKRDPLYGPGFFPLLSKQLGEDLLVFEALREGRRVAMLAAVCSGSVGWVAWVGIGMRDRPNDFTYANLTYYHAADWAPARGLKTLLYGNAVQQLKARRGCRLLDCRLFYRPHREILRPAVRVFLWVYRTWNRWKNR